MVVRMKDTLQYEECMHMAPMPAGIYIGIFKHIQAYASICKHTQAYASIHTASLNASSACIKPGWLRARRRSTVRPYCPCHSNARYCRSGEVVCVSSGRLRRCRRRELRARIFVAFHRISKDHIVNHAPQCAFGVTGRFAGGADLGQADCQHGSQRCARC